MTTGSGGSRAARRPVAVRSGVATLVVVALLAALAGVVLVGARPAAAHAVLVSMTPPPGALLDDVPARITLEFNEPVEVQAGSLNVVDSSGAVVSTPPQREGSTVWVELPAGASGWHAVSWRVASADGHPVSGAWTFRIGGGAAEAPEELEEQAAAASAGSTLARWGWITGQTASALTGVVLTGTLFLALIGLWRERPGRVGPVAVAAVATAVGGLAASAFNGPFSTGGSAFEDLFTGPASGPHLVRSVLATVVAVVVVAVGTSSRSRTVVLWALAAIGLLVVPAFSGHAPSDGAVARVAVAAHLVVAGCWLGAIPGLLRLTTTDPGSSGPVLGRFSLAAGRLLAATVVLGAVATVVLSGGPSEVNPRWGWLLLLKLAFVAVAALAGLRNRVRSTPASTPVTVPATGEAGASGGTTSSASTAAGLDRDPDGVVVDGGGPTAGQAGGGGARATGSGARRALAVEVVALVAVVATSIAMTHNGPPEEPAAGPAVVDLQVADDVRVQLVVDPARTGSNWVHLYTLDPTGLPLEVEDVEVAFGFPEGGIEPIPQVLQDVGSGHRLGVSHDLGLPGRWEVDVRVRVDRFTEATASTSISIDG